jgi:hypothetical protein
MPRLVVNLVTESGGINDGQGDASALLIQLELCFDPERSVLVHTVCAAERFPLTDSDGLDADALLDVGMLCIIGLLALQHLLSTESVHEGCAT